MVETALHLADSSLEDLCSRLFCNLCLQNINLGELYVPKYLQVLQNARAIAVLERLHQEANQQLPKLLFHYLPKLPRLFLGKGMQWDKSSIDFYKDKYIAIKPDQGCLLYLLARSINAKTIVEYGTSYGISTIYLAAAVRDNGGRLVIGTELTGTREGDSS